MEVALGRNQLSRLNLLLLLLLYFIFTYIENYHKPQEINQRNTETAKKKEEEKIA